MPTTELGGQSSANYYEANEPSAIEDVPQDFLSDHEEFLSDDEDANSDDELLLNAGEGDILLGTSLGIGSERLAGLMIVTAVTISFNLLVLPGNCKLMPG
jgi:hypothetical protein